MYPSLERTHSQLNQQKNQLHKGLIEEMKSIIKMVKGKLVGKTQLDTRVFDLLLEYETSYED